MFKKAIFTIACFTATLSLNAQTQRLPSEITTSIAKTPIYQEASLNAPVIHSIAASNTKMQLINFSFDESAQKCTDKQSVFANNLFFEVMLYSNNKAKDNAHGMDSIKGFVPAYYILQDEHFKSILAIAYPQNNPSKNTTPSKAEKNKEEKKKDKQKK